MGFLAFQLDQNLSWKAHSDQVAAKVSRGLGLIRRLRSQLTRSALLTLNHSIVMPYISYGCVIWTSGFYINFRCVQVLHNKVITLLGDYVLGKNDTVNCYRKHMILNFSPLHVYHLQFLYFRVFVVCPLKFSSNVYKDFFVP